MNSNTMTYNYKLHLVNFLRSVNNASDRLHGLTKKVLILINQLESVFDVENEITVKRWREISGEIFVTLEVPITKIDLSKEQHWLTKVFPGCSISGNQVEMSFTSPKN